MDKGAFELQVKGPVAKSEYITRTKTHGRKWTEKGNAFIKTLKEKDREPAFRSLKRKIDHVRKLCEASDTTLETFLTTRDELDLLKDKLGEAHERYESFLETEAEKEASYHWFDVKDRDFTDCRLRICERIHSLERSSYRSEPSESLSHISDRSQSTRNSKNSRKSSSRSVSRARADAATKAARFQVEMEFLEKEHEFRRMQLAKEYALAKAEEKALKKIELECEEGDDKMEAEDDKREIKDQLKDYEVKRESNREITTDVSPFVPSLGPEQTKRFSKHRKTNHIRRWISESPSIIS